MSSSESIATPSRRVRQTRDQIEAVFGTLLDQMSYEDIRIEDVTKRAGIARTTFYLHYASKDALFLGWAERNILNTDFGLKTRDEWLSTEASPQLSALFSMVQRNRMQRLFMFSATKDKHVLMRGMDKLIAAKFEADLHTVFDESQSRIPFSALASAVAGALTRLILWWIDGHTYTAEEAARYTQQVISAMIRDAIAL